MLVFTAKLFSHSREYKICTDAKLVLKRSKYESSQKALRDLHWLPIQARIEFKILILMRQYTYGCGPEYLKELLTRKTVTGSLRTNADDQNNLVIPFNKHKLSETDPAAIVAHISGTAYQMKSKQYNSTPAL